jgi:outer membrane protein assembly factor BamB
VRVVATDGSLVHAFGTLGPVRGSARVDKDGRIYIGGRDDRVHVLTEHGEVLYRLEIGADIDGTCALGPDGTLYVPADDGALHAYR